MRGFRRGEGGCVVRTTRSSCRATPRKALTDITRSYLTSSQGVTLPFNLLLGLPPLLPVCEV
ncbi:MAG: hypothetical protein ACK559_30015, partial [bacterium]